MGISRLRSEEQFLLVRLVGAAGYPEGLEFLLRCRRDIRGTDLGVVEACLVSIAQCGGAGVYEWLLSLASTSRPLSERISAMRAMVASDEARAVSDILGIFNGATSLTMKAFCLEVVGNAKPRIARSAALQMVDAALRGRSPYLRSVAISTILKLKLKGFRACLRKMASDPRRTPFGETIGEAAQRTLEFL